jgi:hypothetical protein
MPFELCSECGLEMTGHVAAIISIEIPTRPKPSIRYLDRVVACANGHKKDSPPPEPNEAGG